MKKLNLFLMILLTTGICYAQNNRFIAHSVGNSITSHNGENGMVLMCNDGRAITQGQWHYYDNGQLATSIGNGNGNPFYWGIMFPAGTYFGNAIPKISAYDYMAMSGTVTIYNDGSSSPTNAVGSTNVSFTGSGNFVEFSFANPLMINPNKNVWIVFYNASGAMYPAAACANTGNANGRWVSTDGTTWEDIASYGLDYTFMVRAYFEQYSNLIVDFEDSQIPTGWTTIDGGIPTGYGWQIGSTKLGSTGNGHNGSNDLILSQSFDNNYGIIYPDNYLISPHVTVANGSIFSFYACAQDASYAAEHFGVAVSTTGTSASDFTMVQEWTMVAKDNRYNGPRGNRAQGNWYYCGVDLSAYAGQPIYVAIRHFNCSDQFYLDIDDILLTNYTQIFHFNINATASPSYGGTVSGGGTYQQGSTCTLHANAYNGYSFFSWTENGVLVSTNPTYSFYVTENRNLVANFVPAGGNKCALVFDLYDSYGDGWNNSILNIAFDNGLPTQHLTMFSGSFVSYELEVNDGANITLTWSSGNWVYECSFIIHYADGTVIYQGSDLNNNFSYNFQMDCPGSTTNYTISVSANPSNGGTVTGGGTYSQGQSCNVTATANSGFTFTNWTENGSVVSTQSNYTFTVNNNRILVANFQAQPLSYTISVSANPTNGGTVTGGGVYQQGQQCTVNATPTAGYIFLRWTENNNQVSTIPNYTFNVSGNRNLVAQFQLENYTINVSVDPSNGGTVSGGGTFHYGENCTVTANNNTGFNFINWTENGNPVSIQQSYTFTVTSSRNLVANFTTQNYIINATAIPSDGGTFTGTGGYNYGDQCTLTATPADGYAFVNWIKDEVEVSTETSYTFTVTESALYEAHFQLQRFTINASANPEDGGSVTGGGSFYYGQTCYLEATPVSDYKFINWTKEGEIVSNQLSWSFTVTENASYEANFDKNIFEITAMADPINGGDVSGAGTYSYGDTCILTATARTGFVFENWTRNDIVVSTSPNYPFLVSRNAEYVAHFTMDANHCIITAIANPNEGGTVSGDGTFELGELCTLSATPSDGYKFIKWTMDGDSVSNNNPYSFYTTENATYIAHFERIPNHYEITVNVEPPGAGSVNGAGTFVEGETCTLMAMSNPTYSFERWTENGIVIDTNEQYSFRVDRARSLVAVFSQGLFYTITASAGNNGAISPEGNVLVEPNEDKTFAMIPNNGCQVSKVLVDGVDRGPLPSYTFRNINENHTIHVEFSGLGVNDNSVPELKVYPNPANDKINIESHCMKKVAVFDLLGVLIEGKEVNDNHTTINLVDLSQGTYILKVEYMDGRIGYSQFVVVK